MKNEALPRLLRSIANGTQAQENRHDVIFNAAADEIERLRFELKELRDLTAEQDDLIAQFKAVSR